MSLSKTMYPGLVNSPETTITNNIGVSDTLIYVLDPSRVPATLPNQMTLGTGTNAETVLVTEVNGSALTVTRGFQGIAKAWPAGTIIARNFTEYDYNALKENVEELDENLGDLAGEGRINETVKDNADAIAAHLAESATDAHVPLNVGLGNVQNYGIASQAEAEAGTAADKYMTPLRTAQAISVLSPYVKNNFSAITNPTANDDSGDGYAVGSVWINTANQSIYYCVDASEGVAVWIFINDNHWYYKLGIEGALWVAGYSEGSGTQSKESDHLHLYAYNPSGSVYGYRTYVTDVAIDLTSINTLKIDWVGTKTGSYAAAYFAVGMNKADLGMNASINQTATFSRTIDSLDVSALTGSYYIKIIVWGDRDTTTHSFTADVYNVWGE